jgi:hypothetical protein
MNVGNVLVFSLFDRVFKIPREFGMGDYEFVVWAGGE